MKTAVKMNKPINTIFAHPKNPRLIRNEKYLEQKKSVAETPEMMLLRPVIIDENFVILGGHQRWRACKELGWDEVPVMQYTREIHLKSESWLVYKKTYETVCAEVVIKDNTHYGEFDYDILANEWDYLPLTEYGVAVWETEPEEVEGLTDEDAVPEAPSEPITKLGDVWILGEHRVMCGDSTSKEAVEILMDGEKADMVFTDPPYGVDVTNTQGSILGDGDLTAFKNSLPILKIFSKKDSHYYVWCASGDMFPPSLEAYCKNLPFQNILPIRVTHENKRGKKGAFKLNFETCIFGNNNEKGFNSSSKFKVSETTLKDSRYKGDGKLKVYPALWDEQRSTEHNMNLIHPTQKNVKMVEFYIEISSNLSSLILDLFLGSGSTLIAAEKTKRKCYGMELDPKYCDVIVKRWEDFTGKKAHLEENEFEVITQAH